jgi:hypothetical protein
LVSQDTSDASKDLILKHGEVEVYQCGVLMGSL